MWKLNKAELGKIFMRPAVYIMVTILTIALIISVLCFSPTTRGTNLTNFGDGTSTVEDVFSAFNNGSSTNCKTSLDNNLETTKSKILNFANTETASGVLLAKTNEINEIITSELPTAFSNFKNSETIANRNALVSTLGDILNLANDCFSYSKNLEFNENLDFYLTSADKENLTNYYKSIKTNIISVNNLNAITNKQLTDVTNKIKDNCSPSQTIYYLNSVKKIAISEEIKTNIINNYYTTFAYAEASTSILTNLYNKIITYVEEHATEDTDEARLETNKLITEYKNASKISYELLKTSFNLEKTSGISNIVLVNYIGFENINTYELKESLSLNKYLMDNSIYDGNYLLNFNFNQASGEKANAYDFTFYALQIVSIIITIFVLFFAVSITAGDTQNGTMKMLATRPITRNDIISGKFLACINFALIFLIFSTIASLIIGFSLYGLSSANILAVMNGATVISIPPALMLIVYLVCTLINIIFYLVIAFLLAIVLRSSLLSMFLTFGLYFFGILFNAISSSATWFVFTPYAHLDLFKYFGNANVSGSFLGMNLTAGANAIVSSIVILCSIIIIDAITKLIFKKRDIA